MNLERFWAANTIALITHGVTQGLDLIKVRQQMLQEGKTFHGLGFQRGDNPIAVFNEISLQGGGMKKFYTSYEGFLARTVLYTTARTGCFLYFYDWINKDPRRYARPDRLFYAAVPAGLIAGIVTNPFELVFSRMQANDMVPRNYSSFYDGLLKASNEGALMRGAVCNGLRISMLLGTMTGLHDWFKENAYYYLGPHSINRFLATAAATGVGVLASMPFDTLRMRLYIQKALPNGVLPYRDGFDAFTKIARFEASTKHSGNFNSFYAGAYTYFVRYLAIFLVSQYLIDFYRQTNSEREVWASARYSYPTGIDFDIHEPFTMAYHKGLIHRHNTGGSESGLYNLDQKTPIKYS